MTANPALKILLKTRTLAKLERERKQRNLIEDEPIYAATIAGKLEGLASGNQWFNFGRCGNEQIYRTCKGCSTVEEFPYRCSLKWCPRCQWWICERRRKVLAAWASKITQPKHLILTQKNFPILTRKKIRDHTKALAKMRRTHAMKTVRGGSVSVEITHSDEGWHLHSHWLIDCRWLDMSAVSVAWGKQVGQEFAICQVKDCRAKEYLNEVTKYVATGSELASWPGPLIWEFISAIRGRRFFFPFGSLFQAGKEIRRQLLAEKGEGKTCDCGCSDFIYETEADACVHEIQKLNRRKR